MPLTEEDVRRIVEEESVRAAARAAAEEPKTGRGRVWKALNTPFAMWLLTTVAVGVITAGYTKLQASLQEAQNKRILVRKLDNEIAGRFLQIHQFARIIEVSDEQRPGSDDSKEIALLLPYLLNGSAGGGSLPIAISIYPQYHGWSFLALLVELESNLSRSAEANAVKTVREKIYALRPKKASSLTDAVNQLDELRLDRWKTIQRTDDQ